MEDLQSRIQAVNDEMFGLAQPEPTKPSKEEEQKPEFIDFYQQNYNNRFEASKRKIAKGSRPKIANDANDILARLRPRYKKAKDDSDILSSQGEKQRASMVKQQYMEEEFLPAVEALVAFNSVDEVLNNKDVLSVFDDCALLDGATSGYTSEYIRNMYDEFRGNELVNSDAFVRDGVARIRSLANRGQIRSAYGVATSLKKNIDNGKNIASDEDYELIQRIILRVS